MADQKLTALTADTSPSSSDLAYSVKDPAGTPLSRKATWLNVLKGAALGVLTSDGDLFTRAAGALTNITRASLAADTAFSSAYAPKATPIPFKRTRLAPGAVGDFTRTSTSFAAVDATNLPYLTLTLAVGDVVECELLATIGFSGVGTFNFDYAVDQPTSADTQCGSTAAGSAGWDVNNFGASPLQPLRTQFVATEAGSHGFRPIYKVDAGTATFRNASSGVRAVPIISTVKNLGQPS